jgi:hypothetical protein
MSLPRDIELAGYPGEAHLQVKPIWPNPGTEAAMTRRMLVLLTAIAFLGSVSSAGAFPKHPITEWIRDLYTAQASRIAQSESLEDADFVALFTPEVVELWRAAHRGPEASLPAEQELDPFFGWRVPRGAKVSFTAVSKVLGTTEAPTLLIDVVVSGAPRRIVLEAIDDEGSWRIANITYDEGEDFAGFERRLAQP